MSNIKNIMILVFITFKMKCLRGTKGTKTVKLANFMMKTLV